MRLVNPTNHVKRGIRQSQCTRQDSNLPTVINDIAPWLSCAINEATFHVRLVYILDDYETPQHRGKLNYLFPDVSELGDASSHFDLDPVLLQ